MNDWYATLAQCSTVKTLLRLLLASRAMVIPSPATAGAFYPRRRRRFVLLSGAGEGEKLGALLSD